MGFDNFKLLTKKNLTPDVFEMIFEIENDFPIIPGQFITFLLPKTGFGRAYSVLDKKGKNLYFIVKRLENGRGGSKEVCDLEIGGVFRGVGPTGHFIDSKKETSKLFLGTGTGMVPLYFIIKDLLESGFEKNIKLILGNREDIDLYYINEFRDFKNKYSNFDFEIYLSQHTGENIYNLGRVTNFLTLDNIKNFDEYYICGNPYMVDDAIKILSNAGIKNENIIREKY